MTRFPRRLRNRFSTKEGHCLIPSASCQKFAQSQALDPSSGTLLNLAICHEQEGKIASAWLEFSKSWSIALRENREDRARLAKERMALLELRLPRILIRPNAASDTAVLLDGVRLTDAEFGVAIPIDPGSHVLEAHAAGKEPMKSALSISSEASTTEVRIPELVEAPRPVSVASSKAAAGALQAHGAPGNSGRAGSTQRAGSYILAGVGVASVAVGVAFGLKALNLKSSADQECLQNRCTPQGSELSHDAVRNAERADASFALAGVSAGLSLYLWLAGVAARPHDVKPSAQATRQVTVAADRRGGSVTWQTRF